MISRVSVIVSRLLFVAQFDGLSSFFVGFPENKNLVLFDGLSTGPQVLY